MPPRPLLRAVLAAAILLLPAAAFAQASGTKIGVVSLQRILSEATPAVAAQKKLEGEFAKRDQDLRAMAERLQKLQQSIERGGVPDSERAARERELNEQGREFQRLQVQFREDLQQRRNEELSSVIEAADKAVKQIADRDKFDIILQEAIYYSPRVDITDQVIKMLNEGRVR